jgi:CDP-paratose 2-epimerase
MRILITGGAGFVGSALAMLFKQAHPSWSVVVFDNLRRRGSELNLAKFQPLGIEFTHGDIRQSNDLEDLPGNFDLMVEASAEPSVLAGLNSSPNYALQTNLAGTLNCLEFARRRAPQMIFLSTSRVYSIAPLKSLRLRETATRLELAEEQDYAGASARGIAENFPTHLPRSLYGATKLASELIIHEYVAAYGLRAVINRCGVIAGPGQFGKVDQGVFTLWVANHYFNRPLQYKGFGGAGKQVRDLLHPRDLFALLIKQLDRMEDCAGEAFNIGGGLEVSTSLCELTALCREVTGNHPEISAQPPTGAVDVPVYISDYARASQRLDWRPTCSVRQIVTEIADWLRRDEAQLRAIFT